MYETVMFRAPVEVTVNTETGEVTRVVVLDTAVEYDDDPRYPAGQMASDADWPAWQIGDRS